MAFHYSIRALHSTRSPVKKKLPWMRSPPHSTMAQMLVSPRSCSGPGVLWADSCVEWGRYQKPKSKKQKLGQNLLSIVFFFSKSAYPNFKKKNYHWQGLAPLARVWHATKWIYKTCHRPRPPRQRLHHGAPWDAKDVCGCCRFRKWHWNPYLIRKEEMMNLVW